MARVSENGDEAQVKARRLGDPERPDVEDEEESFLFRRNATLGFGLVGGIRQRPVIAGGRAERFPGVDVDPATRDPRDVWYQDPIKSSKQ